MGTSFGSSQPAARGVVVASWRSPRSTPRFGYRPAGSSRARSSGTARSSRSTRSSSAAAGAAEEVYPPLLALAGPARQALHEPALREGAERPLDVGCGCERVKPLAARPELRRSLHAAEHEDGEECELRRRQLQRVVE